MFWTSLSDAKDDVNVAKETPLSGANKRHSINCVKDDIVAKETPSSGVIKSIKRSTKGTIKVAKKGRQKVALFICVFLDTKKRKSGSLIICILY